MIFIRMERYLLLKADYAISTLFLKMLTLVKYNDGIFYPYKATRIQDLRSCSKLCFETKSTKLYVFKNVISEKFRKQFCFFTCILPFV